MLSLRLWANGNPASPPRGGKLPLIFQVPKFRKSRHDPQGVLSAEGQGSQQPIVYDLLVVATEYFKEFSKTLKTIQAAENVNQALARHRSEYITKITV